MEVVMAEPVSVQIWSDVQCVWCYFGDARWRDAIAQFDGAVEVTYRSFELQPGFPVDFDAQEYLATARGMDADEQQRAFDALRQIADRVGLPYAPEQIQPTNSHLALQLLHYAESLGRHDAVLDRLFAAYFAKGGHVGTVDSLVELAVEAGLDAHDVRTALETAAFADAVDADTAEAAALGVQGVPFAVVNGTYAVPGALETPQLLDLLRRAAA
jgi:predicted DsbA family dithiol-disulfide isomerase